MIENIMDQKGQARSPETAAPTYFTEEMKRYARRVFDVYDPIGPNRGFKLLPREIKCYGPFDAGHNRKKTREILQIRNKIYIHNYHSKEQCLQGTIYSNKGPYLKISYENADGKFRFSEIELFVRFSKRSVSSEYLYAEQTRLREFKILQDNHVLNPGFARYVITQPDLFGFHPISQVIEDYVQARILLSHAKNNEAENYEGDFYDSVLSEIDFLDDYHILRGALESDVCSYSINSDWKQIQHEEVVCIFENWGHIVDKPYLTFGLKGRQEEICLPSPKNSRQFIMNCIGLCLYIKARGFECESLVDGITSVIPSRQELADVLALVLSLEAGGLITGDEKKSKAYQIASEIHKLSALKTPQSSKKLHLHTSSELLVQISRHLKELNFDFL